MRGLADQVLDLARRHPGEWVTVADALRTVFNGNGHGAAPRTQRRQLRAAIETLEVAGVVISKRGAFALKPSRNGDDDGEEDGVRPHPLAANVTVAARINRLASIVNEFHAELTELRHDLQVAERFNDPRPYHRMCSIGLPDSDS